MDAEIGVRDLSDALRYNVLPDIVDAIGLAREVFEDLQEFEKLFMLVCRLINKGFANVADSNLSHERKRSSTTQSTGHFVTPKLA